jgi:hypothetical protein
LDKGIVKSGRNTQSSGAFQNLGETPKIDLMAPKKQNMAQDSVSPPKRISEQKLENQRNIEKVEDQKTPSRLNHLPTKSREHLRRAFEKYGDSISQN